MDAKITLSFDKEIIERSKRYAKAHNISLSRLMEFLLRQLTSGNYRNLEELPVSDWVHQIAEGEAQYFTMPRSRKSMKKEFLNSRK